MGKSNDINYQKDIFNQDIKDTIAEFLDSSIKHHLDPELIRPVLEKKILSMANRRESFNMTLEVVRSQINQLIEIQKILSNLEFSLTKKAKISEKKDRYDKIWWKMTQERLQANITVDIEEAFDYWLQLYSEALIDCRLDIFIKLV